MKNYHVHVTFKEGVFDSAGDAATKKLAELGHEGVERVSVGKFIRLTVAGDVTEDQVRTMCDELLVNPIIEDFTISEEA